MNGCIFLNILNYTEINVIMSIVENEYICWQNVAKPARIEVMPK